MSKLIRAIIIEDELHSRDYLKNLIDEYFDDVEIVGEAENVDSSLKLIAKSKPDLVFLDIHLGKESGFDILEKIEYINFEIIFITAYQEYAIKAFKFAAVSYILKPIDTEELINAVDRVKSRQDSKDINKRLGHLLDIIQKQDGSLSKLALPVHDGYLIISMFDIIHIEADGSYSIIYMLKREKIMVSKNISAIEELLTENVFIRVHKSNIINLNFLKKFVKNNGSSYVVMSDDSTVDVSIRRKKDLIDRLNKLKY